MRVGGLCPDLHLRAHDSGGGGGGGDNAALAHVDMLGKCSVGARRGRDVWLLREINRTHYLLHLFHLTNTVDSIIASMQTVNTDRQMTE